MNTRKIIPFLTIALIMVFTSACGPSATVTETSIPTLDPLLNTSIAETAQSGVFGTLTQIALSLPTSTPTLQFTQTPTMTSTATATATSMKPMISVVVATLCRTGPGTVYDRVGELNINTLVEVYALDPSHSYYFIQNPNQPGSYCWVWGFYATPVNSYVGIPIYTPAYTPTPAISSTPTLTRTPTGTVTPVPGFTITNPVKRDCSGNQYLDVTITNIGGTIFKSGSVTIYNGTTVLVPTNASNDFVDLVGCDIHYSQGDLAPKEVGNLSSSVLPSGFSGKTLTIEVTLCSLDGMGGVCTTKSITYKS